MPRRLLFVITMLLGAVSLLGEDVYWSAPELLPASGKFMQTAAAENLGVAVWQEFAPDNPGAEQGSYYFSLRSSSDGIAWKEARRCLGPYPYQDKAKQYRKYSVALDGAGRILIAFAADDHTVAVFASTDQGTTFAELARLPATHTVNVPLLSVSARGELLLLVTYLMTDDEGIYLARSGDGRSWTPLSPFVSAAESIFQPELPFHAVFKRKDCVVFQARRTRPTEFQLFLKTSGDGGNTWTSAIPLTESLSTIDGEAAPVGQISNQRPFLLPYKNELLLTWERNRTFPPRSPQVYVMSLQDAGRTKDDKGKAKPELRISRGTATVYNPQLVLFKDRLYNLWFENQPGQTDQILFCAYTEDEKNRDIAVLSPNVAGDSLFPQAVVVKGALSLFWENQRRAQNQTDERLFFLGPDRYVAPPVINPVGFSDQGFGRLTRLRFRWDAPDDSSGIQDLGWVVSRQKAVGYKDAQLIRSGATEQAIDLTADGTWYLSLFARDGAGNVSTPAQVSYTRDTVPPGAVRFLSPEPDADGYFATNTFTVTWAPPAGDTIGGYSYTLSELNGDPAAATVSAADYPVPDDAPALSDPKVDFLNLENGVWALSVSAFDKARNKGSPGTIVFRLNHYQAKTYITTVNAATDGPGRLSLTILGRGFAEGGAVDEIVIDRDGREPYDYTFTGAGLRVESDRLISGVSLNNVAEGLYQVGVRHPVRGFVFSGKEMLRVESTGVIKYGDFEPPRSTIDHIYAYVYSLSFADLMLWFIVLFLIVLFFIAGQRAISLSREAVWLRTEARLLLLGGSLPMKETKKKIESLKRRGIGLRLKFTLLISLLALLIVLIVSLPISLVMTRIQQTTLAQKMRDEVNIVLSGIVDGTKTYLFLNNNLLVSENLEKQYKQLPAEAEYAVVTGPRFINPRTGETDLSGTTRLDVSSMERVWAFQPPTLTPKVKTGAFQPIESEIADDVSPLLKNLSASIDANAREKASALNKDIDARTDERDGILFRTDKASLDRKAQLESQIKDYTKQRDLELEKIADDFRGSLPEFNIDNLDLSVSSYIFYKPVVTRVRNYDRYFWGLARLAVSTKDIDQQIQSSRRALIYTTGVIALVAIGLGLAGALILASIIITPLRRLSRGVAVIRDTQDKSELKDHQILVRTHDEIRDLADTVNQMTQGLVKAAIANKELVIGQEVQKMFIPLESGPDGKKRTTGSAANQFIDIFGYYEGAKVVSGDYFDFKKLDDRHFAIMKCDVAGKGVAGSLIMIEVATLFLSYFRDWSLKKDGLKIEWLVNRINDMLEERGFKGRFAQLSLCLLDSATGVCHLCHAGDKELRIYRSRQAKIETVTLANTPAAGVFHTTMIPPASGFRVEPQKLEPGDMLLLVTDGLEEAKRYLRDGAFAPIVCAEPGLKDNESHGGTHTRGQDSEELGMQRVEAIIEAVNNKRRFDLVKYHNPLAEEELAFDFTGCQGTAEEAVLALAAVEKVFRIYPDASATAEDVIRVDRKIDAFLSRTFTGYHAYFKNRAENPGEPDYVFYPGLKEDEQYDDLTILAVRKK